MQEMGCNAVRLCHYPKPNTCINRWIQGTGGMGWIPFVNVYVNNPAYDENLRLQLKELILQNYNHLHFVLGLFNEINSVGWTVLRVWRQSFMLWPVSWTRNRPTIEASNQG